MYIHQEVISFMMIAYVEQHITSCRFCIIMIVNLAMKGARREITQCFDTDWHGGMVYFTKF